ncbi:phage tail protein [Ureibacillus sp. 179-F W5.1 NHS]|uniref:Phage tail protein n=1 Tax=Lysinibacillus halotolerans TaxID=1368476 RepID=A0A3M8H1B6_9BACI|nr:phage tail protein [Lysinibacillus halotolerans]RNC96267.1 phage tail protein [Lysinibacillus halotolerans]
MPVTVFDTTDISHAGIRFKQSGGTYGEGTDFGLVGTMEGEGEVQSVQKMQGARIIKQKSKTTKIAVTVSGHIPVQVARDYFGMTNEKLKAGVYSAGINTLGKDFIFTVTAVDDFEGNKKLMAFPNCSNSGGFKITPLEAAVEEVAMLELTFDSLPDSADQFYYEAIVADTTDPTLVEQWHTNFSRELVELVETV